MTFYSGLRINPSSGKFKCTINGSYMITMFSMLLQQFFGFVVVLKWHTNALKFAFSSSVKNKYRVNTILPDFLRSHNVATCNLTAIIIEMIFVSFSYLQKPRKYTVSKSVLSTFCGELIKSYFSWSFSFLNLPMATWKMSLNSDRLNSHSSVWGTLQINLSESFINLS